jgi:hypothetical protein
MAVFWVVAPCSMVEVYRRFRGSCCLHHQGDDVSYLMMEAASTSETSVNFYQTTRRNNPEDSHLRTNRREKLKHRLWFLLETLIHLSYMCRNTFKIWGFEVCQNLFELVGLRHTATENLTGARPLFQKACKIAKVVYEQEFQEWTYDIYFPLYAYFCIERLVEIINQLLLKLVFYLCVYIYTSLLQV